MFSFFTPKKPHKWVGLFLISLALAIIIIDGTVLSVSQSAIIETIGVTAAQIPALEGFLGIQWTTTLYALTVASFTIVGGRLADKYGKKKIFLLGAAIFALGSIITALAYYWGVSRQFGSVTIYGIQVLLVGWSLLEGIGAALMMPATLSLIVSNFSGKERTKAFAVWGSVAGFSAALGPILGGYFTTYANWSWAFLINVIVVALLLLFSGYIYDGSKRNQSLRIDITSVVLSGAGMASLIYGFIESGSYGWWIAKKPWQSLWGSLYELPFGLSITPYTIGLGLIILFLFVLRQKNLTKTSTPPLVDLQLFCLPQFNVGLLSIVFFTVAFSSLMFALPFFLQIILGKNAFDSGVAFLPFSIASLIAAPLGMKLSERISPKKLVLLGIATNGIGLFWISYALNLNWQVSSFAFPFCLIGLGGGLAQAQLGNLTMSEVSSDKAGEASGVQSAVRQLGQTMSTAVIGSVFVATLAHNVQTSISAMPDQQLPQAQKKLVIDTYSQTQPLYSIAPAEQEKALSATYKLTSGERSEKLMHQARTFVPEYIRNEIRGSVVQSSKSAMMAGAVASIIALICALLFRDKKLNEKSGDNSDSYHMKDEKQHEEIYSKEEVLVPSTTEDVLSIQPIRTPSSKKIKKRKKSKKK